MKEISEKRKKFCLEYLKDFNVRKASLRAGYSETMARNKAYQLLKDSSVRDYLKSLKIEHVEKAQLTVEAVLKEIQSIAFALADGELIKTADKLKALELMGRNLGIFNDKDLEPKNVRINVMITIVDKVEG